MRIIQLTDLHIAGVSTETHGIDVRTNFLKVLAEAADLAPDFYVITGDLCYDHGGLSIYKWIHEEMEQLGTPYFCISGNHDKPRELAGVFGLEADLHGGELYFSKKLKGQSALFLDSTVGRISDRQLNWCAEQLGNCEGPLLVFIHHPFLEVPIPHMESHYPLHNREALQQVLRQYAGPIFAFCGHYHAEFTVCRGHMQQYLTPSCFFQITPYEGIFEQDHYRPAFRVIDWYDGFLQTTVRYIWG